MRPTQSSLARQVVLAPRTPPLNTPRRSPPRRTSPQLYLDPFDNTVQFNEEEVRQQIQELLNPQPIPIVPQPMPQPPSPLFATSPPQLFSPLPSQPPSPLQIPSQPTSHFQTPPELPSLTPSPSASTLPPPPSSSSSRSSHPLYSPLTHSNASIHSNYSDPSPSPIYDYSPPMSPSPAPSPPILSSPPSSPEPQPSTSRRNQPFACGPAPRTPPPPYSPPRRVVYREANDRYALRCRTGIDYFFKSRLEFSAVRPIGGFTYLYKIAMRLLFYIVVIIQNRNNTYVCSHTIFLIVQYVTEIIKKLNPQ